jgi:hypothetical protein
MWWLTAGNYQGSSKRDYEKRPQIILLEDEGQPSFALRATTTAGSGSIYVDGGRWVKTKRASHGRSYRICGKVKTLASQLTSSQFVDLPSMVRTACLTLSAVWHLRAACASRTRR